MFLPLLGRAQQHVVLTLPNHEYLSAERVLHVMQDTEGFLWYATDGGGVCRDDGRQMLVFKSDAARPDLLGSNNVACLCEADGRYIIIGTSHGANVLDKQDYTIRRLTEVDDKRVDDIIVGADGHWWLTANMKVYEYAADGRWLKTYAAGDKYLARLHEDRRGQLWATQWNGGLIKLVGDRFEDVPWPLDAAPTDIADDSLTGRLLVGTLGKGVVRYHPDNGTVELTEPSDSICMSRVSLDLQGRRLVSDGMGRCYVLADGRQQPWFSGQEFTRFMADSIRTACGLSARPTAIAERGDGELWFSTGKDIRQMKHGRETVVLEQTDVSAMAYTADGTLWLATIFGTVMAYRDGQLVTDEYASNEYGDAVTQLDVDSMGRLLLVYDRYVRCYDPVRHTLRQQSREADGVYSIELQETAPGVRWSQPRDDTSSAMPRWVWWMLAALLMVLVALIIYILFLRRQRNRFLAEMKDTKCGTKSEEQEWKGDEVAVPAAGDSHAVAPAGRTGGETPWLQHAIAMVESHLSDDGYSVEQLANDLCMSRMTFYRKIQSATGQKPTEFMRTIRLRHAADLLRQGQLSITEISYAAGFSSVSYFSRCFRTMYGVPPTLFMGKPDHTPEAGRATTADGLSPSEPFSNDSGTVPR